ncbi:MAG: hypothetical protein QXU47_02600 [Candidatus Bathyarchaeia archaeon]
MTSLAKKTVLAIAVLIMVILPVATMGAETNDSTIGDVLDKVFSERNVAFLVISIMVAVVLSLVAMALSRAASAAIGAVAEKPEIASSTLIYIVFIEAIAIYALIIALMMLTML